LGSNKRRPIKLWGGGGPKGSATLGPKGFNPKGSGTLKRKRDRARKKSSSVHEGPNPRQKGNKKKIQKDLSSKPLGVIKKEKCNGGDSRRGKWQK